MKLFMVFTLSLFSLAAQAQTSNYTCDFKKLLSAGADYENINDFTFADYPYLEISRIKNAVVGVSIGAMEYTSEDNYEFMVGSTKEYFTIKLIVHAEEGFPLYKAFTVFIPKANPDTALVESHEEGLAGPIAEFNNCK